MSRKRILAESFFGIELQIPLFYKKSNFNAKLIIQGCHSEQFKGKVA